MGANVSKEGEEGVNEGNTFKNVIFTWGTKFLKGEDDKKSVEEGPDVKGDREEDAHFAQKNYRDPRIFVQPAYGKCEAIERKQISEEELIILLSEGIMSRGFFISEDLHDSTQKGKSLITMIKEMKCIPFEIGTSTCSYEFSSKEQFQSFQKYVTDFGISAATQIYDKMPSVDYKKENIKKSESHFAFAAREDVEIVRCCLVSAGDMQYQFTEEASKKLQSLENMLFENKDHFIKECQHFFHEFGSHIYCGVYTLGGIYRYTASCKSEETTVKSDAKLKVATAIQGLIQLNNFSGESLQNEETDEFNVKKNILKIGGPPELDNKDDWKRELLQQRSTWAIIDRDILGAPTYRGIWELVIEKESLFSDAKAFAAELQRVWKEIPSHRSLNIHLAKEKYQQAKKKFLESQSEKNLLALKEAVDSVEKHGSDMQGEGIFFKTEVEESHELQENFRNLVNGDTLDAKTKLELCSVLHPLKDIESLEDIKSKLPPEQHFHNPYAYVSFYP